MSRFHWRWLAVALLLAVAAIPGRSLQTSQQALDDEVANGPSLSDTLDFINQNFLIGDVQYTLSVSADHATLIWTETDPDGTKLTRTAPAAALDAERVDPAINGTVGDLDVACLQGKLCAKANDKPVNSFYVQGFFPDDDPLAAAQDAVHHLIVLLQAEARKKAG